MTLDPACASVVAALEHNPFYRSICAPHFHDASCRRAILAQYFSYSIQEGKEMGRCVHLPDPTLGVAVWLLPQSPDVQERASQNKCAFLEATLPTEGCANYYRIVQVMSGKAASLVDHPAWYLSILAVDPSAQGQGLGRKLLEPAIAEADRLSATCYLETFTPRNISFYERLGFATQAQFTEPTTTANYALMVRHPILPL
jgi:GNAT superfamily N-acetyltransferase